MKDLIDFVARSIAKNPEEVEVSEVDDGRLLELRVADDDLGRIIGRRGRTAQALRTLLQATAGRGEQAVELEIVEREESDAE